MTGPDPLLLRFAETHPREVAAALAGFEVSESAAFAGSLPPALAAEVLGQMRSQPLGDLLAGLDRERLVGILLAARRVDRTTLLAQLPSTAYPDILEAADEQARPALERLFRAPVRSLSSLAQPDFIRVGAAQACADVKHELEAFDADSDPPLFAVNEQAVFRGIVPPLAILAERNASRPVLEVAEPIDPLSGQVPIRAALAAPQWRRHATLPVVDAAGHILGAVTREQLEAALGEGDREAGLEGILQLATTGYLGLCAELLEVAIGAERK